MKASGIIREIRNEQKSRNTTKVMEFEINGKKIKTNYGAYEYALWNGEYPTNKVVKRVDFGHTDGELLDELIDAGYTYIRFVESTTCVRGYHNIHAICKR